MNNYNLDDKSPSYGMFRDNKKVNLIRIIDKIQKYGGCIYINDEPSLILVNMIAFPVEYTMEEIEEHFYFEEKFNKVLRGLYEQQNQANDNR